MSPDGIHLGAVSLPSVSTCALHFPSQPYLVLHFHYSGLRYHVNNIISQRFGALYAKENLQWEYSLAYLGLR